MIQGILRSIVQDCDQVASACQLLRQHGIDYASDPRLQRSFRNLQQYLPERPSKLSLLKEALGKGHFSTVMREFPIGTEIPDVWTNPKSRNYYDDPLIIVHYDLFRCEGQESLTQGAVLLRKHAFLPVWPCFSHERMDEYVDSFVRHWLNDDDFTLDESVLGYIAGCSAELLGLISSVQLFTDELRSDSTLSEHYDRFFLPSYQNLGMLSADGKLATGVIWGYFLDTPADGNQVCEKRTFLDQSGNAQDCRLRDRYPMGRTDAHHRYTVDKQGRCRWSDPTVPCCVVPACVITA